MNSSQFTVLSSRFSGLQLRALALSVSLWLIVLLSFSAAAQDTPQPVTDDDVNAIAKQMYCPVCENIPLDVCPTVACDQWRSEIRSQLESGLTSDEIITNFVNRYGDRVVGTPQDPLLRALSLLTPVLIAIGALFIARRAVLRWRHSRATAPELAAVPSAPGVTDDDYRTRLERDLQTRR